jgi:hypothetical protein
MPVTSPSYFPPSRGTDQIVGITAGQSQTGARVFLAGQSAGAHSTISDFIAIGDTAASGAAVDAALSGTTVIGSKSLSTLANTSASLTTGAPVTALGFNIAPLATSLSGSVLIGDHVAAGFNGGVGAGALGIDSCVMIGSQVYLYPNAVVSQASSPTLSVIIGYQAYQGVGAHNAGNGMAVCFSNVVIGAQACANVGNAQATGTGITTAVVIGASAGLQMGNSNGAQPAGDVVIGYASVNDYVFGSNNVFIGAGNSTVGVSGTVSNNTAIGYGIKNIGNLNNTLLGSNITGPGLGGNQCIFIGAWAGRTQAGGVGNIFILETNISPNQHALFYGRLDTGSLIIGNSTEAAGNRDLATLGGTNLLKLLNGTVGGTAAGGGYLYVSAGALHWKGSSGTDTTLAPA